MDILKSILTILAFVKNILKQTVLVDIIIVHQNSLSSNYLG